VCTNLQIIRIVFQVQNDKGSCLRNISGGTWIMLTQPNYIESILEHFT
jgi:hypothetical protein